MCLFCVFVFICFVGIQHKIVDSHSFDRSICEQHPHSFVHKVGGGGNSLGPVVVLANKQKKKMLQRSIQQIFVHSFNSFWSLLVFFGLFRSFCCCCCCGCIFCFAFILFPFASLPCSTKIVYSPSLDRFI